MTNLPENWTICHLDDVLNYEQPQPYIVSNENYSDEYKTPVLTAGKSFIIGKTNDDFGIYDKLPVIIFDDFTTSFQLVNFKFKVKSSAMKILSVSHKDFDIKFFYYLMKTIDCPHETHKRYWISDFSQKEIPLPPLAEQGRIVQKIEELFADIDAGIQNLKSVQDQIKLYRQSVLKSAFDNDFKHLTLNDLCSVISDGDHQPPPKANEGVPFIVISNLHGNTIDLKETMFVKKDYFLSLPEKRKPRRNDVLYSVVGSYGIPALVDFDDEFCFQRHIALLRPDIKKLYPKFLFYVLQSRNVYNQATNCSTGTAQKTVPLSGLRSISIPLPTLDEQERIVAEIEKRFERANELEKAVNDALADAEKMKQAILKKAFRGELVAQNPDDEPAAVLLDRIRAERASAPKSLKKGKRK